MNTLTEQSKDRVTSANHRKLKLELEAIDILQNQMNLDLALGKFEDAMSHAQDIIKSLRSINQLALNKELADRVMTVNEYLKVVNVINSGD
ncbi:hypothetical protein [Sporolactobacillus terrae]|uniref:hypothetical protein n=1 Tax=Sporolactobacillus terrae TaxID=269673 RepID=UPI00048E7D6D|nr:hypothetical protein [Sporolactobacillus terrae]